MPNSKSNLLNTMNNDPLNTPLNIAIIGGGLTGLITADLLEKVFKQSSTVIKITIFEKSAGVGRLATRYRNPAERNDSTEDNKQWQFDFGAQFFTAKSDRFQSYLQPWLGKKVIEPWHAKVATIDDTNVNIIQTTQWDDDQPRYISSPKMTSFGRAIAKALQQTTIHYKTRVAPLKDNYVEVNKTSLVDISGNSLGIYDWVICTAPQPQVRELMAQTDFVDKMALSQNKMLACYTLMLGWRDKQALPDTLKQVQWDVLEIEQLDNSKASDNSYLSNSPLSVLGKVFIEHHKPHRDILPSVTIHSSNTWAEQHVEDNIEEVQTVLLASAQSLLQWNEANKPDHIDCHRWRYAATVQEDISLITQNAYLDNRRQWIVTGDWCIEGRIESCFDAAEEVVKIITKNIFTEDDI